MKHWVLTLLLAAASLSLSAQGEEDFASRYMKLYAEGTSLTCSTVSPQMMARVMNVAEADNDPHLRQVLSQMKSLRVVRSGKPEESGPLYEKPSRCSTITHSVTSPTAIRIRETAKAFG